MSLGLDEEKAQAGEAERQVDDLYGKLRIIWLAILAGLVAVFVVTRLVEGRAGGGLDVVFWILLAVGAVGQAASFVLKEKMLKQSAAEQKPELARSAYILAYALCESVALLGLVAHFITGHRYYYWLFIIGGFGVVVHKPQRDDLLAAVSGAGRVWEAKKQG